ncbi:hypothetical protein [Streptomyces sp. NPDC002057]|uniref:hypothetical protein n=1 Tax=Streptomyces sp. NPDC002057 TaxID=3154664 RepID=UPI00331977BB
MPPAPDADAPGHTHDPGEVTVQLDAVRMGGGGPSLRPAVTVPEPRRAPQGPVFVDESGRRGRRFRHLGTVVGVACAAYAVVIVATLLTGNSAAPWVPLPEQGQAVPAERGEASPSPTPPAAPSPTTSTPSAPTTTSDGDRRSVAPVRTADSSANTPEPTTPAPTASTATPTPRTTTESPGPDSSGTPTTTPTTPAPTGTPTTAPATTAPTGTTAPETTAPPVASGSVALGHSRPASAGQDHVPPSPEIIL